MTTPTFTRFAEWFSTSRRRAIQALITITLTLLVLTGPISGEQSSALNEVAASFLLLLQGVIGITLLQGSDFYTWLNTAGRGLLYGASVAVGAAGIAFGLWAPGVADQIVAITTVCASILTAFVQVVNAHTLDGELFEPTVDPTGLNNLARFASIQAPATHATTILPDDEIVAGDDDQPYPGQPAA